MGYDALSKQQFERQRMKALSKPNLSHQQSINQGNHAHAADNEPAKIVRKESYTPGGEDHITADMLTSITADSATTATNDEKLWVKFCDRKTGKIFYRNEETGANQWDRPDDYKSSESDYSNYSD